MKKSLSLITLLCLLSALFAVGAAGEETGSPPADAQGYIVKLTASLDELDGSYDLRELSGRHGLYWCGDAASASRLLADGLADYIEPDRTVRLQGKVNDTYYAEQWNLAAIHAEDAWEAGVRGADVHVGILDSGLNAAHEEFEGIRIGQGYNVITGGADVTDYSGHGSFVAGIIAAKSNNGKGIAGIAEEVTLFPIKCFSRSDETAVSYVIDGIYHAVDESECDVINMSLALPADLRSFREAIGYALDRGVILVSAVGNGGGTDLMYPAAYDGVVGVGSVGRNGGVSRFSERNASVFAVAPGEEIYSIGNTGSSYLRGDGTSFAVPHVTAMAILAKCVNRQIDIDTFKTLLMESAGDRGEAGYDKNYGYGLIDIAAFMKLLTGMETPPSGISAFSDIEGHWAEPYIQYCLEQNLFNGTSAVTFEPDKAMNRAMLVTVLWRMAGSPPGSAPPFYEDVPDGAWYAPAVNWCAENGVVTGFDGGLFRPLSDLTREQTAAILYRWERLQGGVFPEESAMQLNYDDAEDISDWAYEAVAWCSMEGIMTGLGGNRFEARGGATRAQVAAVLERYMER